MPFRKIRGNNITNYTIETEQLSNTATAAFTKSLEPRILYANVASNTYTILDDAAVNIGGGYIVVTGSNFQSGATVLIDTDTATSVSYINSTTLRAQVPAKSAASYNLYVVNPDGGIGIKPVGITYSSVPSWVTTSPLANVSSNSVFSGTFSATGATSYANTTILPTGFTLLSNGYYYGNISVGVATTYSFDIAAIDSELQDSTKTFSLTTTVKDPSYTLNYLVIAGGGGGGGGTAGGGGAGGFTANSFTANSGTVYTITVGGGGSAGYPFANPSVTTGRGTNGSNSTLTNPGPAISAIGGGGGGGGSYPSVNSTISGGSGGSGGGGAAWWGSGSAGLATGSPGIFVAGSQGYPGSNGLDDSPWFGGGGGGAGGSGGTAGPPGPSGYSGAGGPGKSWTYTGPAILYAGGGSGGLGSPGGNIGSTSAGGGAGGVSGTNGNSAQNNLGGGGGGAGGAGYTGGNGGSGVVKIAVPSINYTGIYTGSNVAITTPPAAPGMTVLTYNSSGTYTA